MKDDSKLKFVFHWMRGIKMESETCPYLRFSIGTAILIVAAAYFVSVIAPNGFF